MDRISIVILVLILVLVLHLVEEVRTGFRKKLIIGEMPLPLFAGINVLIYTFCLATFLLLLYGYTLGITFAWVFAAGMLLNGTGHISFMVIKRAYFPGGLTAVLILPLSVYLILLLAGL